MTENGSHASTQTYTPPTNPVRPIPAGVTAPGSLVSANWQAMQSDSVLAQLPSAIATETLGTPLDKILAAFSKLGVASGDIFNAILANPQKFINFVLSGIANGFTQYLNNFVANVQAGFLKWLTGSITLPALPKSLSTADLTSWLLNAFNLNWDGIQQMLITAVGPGNVALLSQGYNMLAPIFQNIANGGSLIDDLQAFLETNSDKLSIDNLGTQVLNALTNVIVTKIENQAIPLILSYINPAVGGLSGLYRAVTWIGNNIDTLVNLLGSTADLAQRIAAVMNATDTSALNNAKTALSNQVNNLLVTQTPTLLSFGFSMLGLGDIPKQITDAIAKVKAYPTTQIQKALNAIVDKAKSYLALLKMKTDMVGAPYAFTYQNGGVNLNLQVWVANAGGGKYKIMRSVNGNNIGELNLSADLPSTLPHSDPKWKAVSDAQAKLAADAATIVANQPASKTDTSKVPALTKALAAFAKDLRTLMDDLVAAGATCFFGQACFAAGTPIRTPDGWQAIETFKIGDMVLSRDENNANGEVVAKVVEEIFERIGEVLWLRVDGVEIGTTAEHPFYAWERGWVAARELAVGDTVLCEDGAWRAVESIRNDGEWRTVYNFRIADFHTYFVGENASAVWAHNAYIGTYSRVGSYLESQKVKGYQIHHIGQDAVMISLEALGFNYSYYAAPCINLFGGSGQTGSSHNLATQVQRTENSAYRRAGITQITIQQESVIVRAALVAARNAPSPGPLGPLSESDITIAMTEFWKYFTTLTNAAGEHPTANTLVTLSTRG